MQSSDEYTVEYANSEEPRERLLDQTEIFRKSRNLILGQYWFLFSSLWITKKSSPLPGFERVFRCGKCAFQLLKQYLFHMPSPE